MKIITLHKPVNITSVYNHLNQNIDRVFQAHKPGRISFQGRTTGKRYRYFTTRTV